MEMVKEHLQLIVIFTSMILYVIIESNVFHVTSIFTSKIEFAIFLFIEKKIAFLY